MSTSTVFTNNRTQAVRLAELRFPDHIRKVNVRAVGNERIIAPADQAWDSFFLAPSYRARISWLSAPARNKRIVKHSEPC